LVGADEVSHDHISIDSPLARALLKKRVGDAVRVLLPKGEVEFEVLAVGY
jgi:transcription elongation factor GreB